MYPPGVKTADIKRESDAAKARKPSPYDRISAADNVSAAVTGSVRRNNEINSEVGNNDVFLPTLHNTVISNIAGFKKAFSGTDMEAIKAADKWQEENSIALGQRMNEAISRDYYDASGSFNSARFASGMGNVVGSAMGAVAGSVAGGFMGGSAGPGGVVAGAFGGAVIGSGISYGLTYNELITESINAGLPIGEAVAFSHSVALSVTLIEAVGTKGLGKSLTSPMIKSSIRSFLPGALKNAYGEKMIGSAASQVLKSGAAGSGELFLDLVQTSTKGLRNQLVERMIVTGGVATKAAFAGAAEEFSQNMYTQFAKSMYDKMRAGAPGVGDGFNDQTPMWDKIAAAAEEGMYGAIMQGGMAGINIIKPVYETALYGTLTKMDSDGRLDEGVQAIRASLIGGMSEGTMSQSEMDGAVQTFDNVVDSYKKMGGRVMKPSSRFDVFQHIKEKKNIQNTALENDMQIEEVRAQVEAGTFDETLANIRLSELEQHKVTLDQMMALTNDGMTRASDTFVPIIKEGDEALGAQISERTDLALENAIKDKESVFSGTVASLIKLRDETKSKIAKASGQEIEHANRIFGEEDFHQSHTILDEYERGWSDSVATIVKAEGPNGQNYFVAKKSPDGSTTEYRMVPNVPLYRSHLDKSFENKPLLRPIAMKIESGMALTVEEEALAKDMSVEVNGERELIAKRIQQVSEEKVRAGLEGREMSSDDREIEATFPDRVNSLSDPMAADLTELSSDIFKSRMGELHGKPSDIDKVVGKKRIPLYARFMSSINANINARYNKAVEVLTEIELEGLASKMAKSPEKYAEYAAKNSFRQGISEANADAIASRSQEIIQQRADVIAANAAAKEKAKDAEKAAGQEAKDKAAKEKENKKKKTTNQTANDTGLQRSEQGDDAPAVELEQAIDLAQQAASSLELIITTAAESQDPASAESGVPGLIVEANNQLEQINNELGPGDEQSSTGEGDAAQQPGILANSLVGTGDSGFSEPTPIDYSGLSDAEIEERMSLIELDKSLRDEYNSLEATMERREWDSVFQVPIGEANSAIKALVKKEKEMPNGFGSFIEPEDAKESLEVIDRYLSADGLTDPELMADFKSSMLGNPDTWYADGLKLRWSIEEASRRGLSLEDMLAGIEERFVLDGYTLEDARAVVSIRLSRIAKKYESTPVTNPEAQAAPAPKPALTGPPIGVLGSLRQKIDEVVSIMNDAIATAPVGQTKAFVREAVAAMRDQGAFVTGFDADGNPVRGGAFEGGNIIGSYAAVFTVNTNKSRNIVAGVVYKGQDGALYIKSDGKDSKNKKIPDVKIGERVFVLAGPKDAASLSTPSGLRLRQLLTTIVTVEGGGDLEIITEKPVRDNLSAKENIKRTMANAIAMAAEVWARKTEDAPSGRARRDVDITESLRKSSSTASDVLAASGVDLSMIFYRGPESSNDNLLTALLWADSHDRIAAKKTNDELSPAYIPDKKRKSEKMGGTTETVVAESEGVETVMIDRSESHALQVGDVFYVPSLPELKRGVASMSMGSPGELSVVNSLGQEELHNTFTVIDVSSDLVSATDQYGDVWVLDPRETAMIAESGKRMYVSSDVEASDISIEERVAAKTFKSVPLGKQVQLSQTLASSLQIDGVNESGTMATFTEAGVDSKGEATYKIEHPGGAMVLTLNTLQAVGLRVRSGGDASSSLAKTGTTHTLSMPSSPKYGGPARATIVMDGTRVESISIYDKTLGILRTISSDQDTIEAGVNLGFNKAGNTYFPVSFFDFVNENGELRPEVKVSEKSPRAAAGQRKTVSQRALNHGVRILAMLRKALPNIKVSMNPGDFQRALAEAESAGSVLTYMETNNGVLYGFEWNGALYFNPEYLTGEIAIHEFGHIWKTWAKFNSPQLYQSAMSAVAGTTYESTTRKDYGHLDSDESVLDEAFSRALGDAFNGNLSDTSRLGSVVNRIWNMIRQAFGFDPVMTLEGITDQVLSDLLGGNVLSDITSERVAFLESTGQKEIRAAYTRNAGVIQKSDMDSVQIAKHYDALRKVKSQMRVFSASGGAVEANLATTADDVFNSLSAIISDARFMTNDITGTRVTVKELKALTPENVRSVIEMMSRGESIPSGELSTLRKMAFSKGESNIAQKYHKWFKRTHISVVDDAGGEAFSLLNADEVSKGMSNIIATKAQCDTVSKRKAFGMLFGFMKQVWNFDTVAGMMGQDNAMKGIYNLRRQRNADASQTRAAMYDKMKLLNENYKDQAAEFIDINFTDQNGVVVSKKMSVSESIQIMSNYRTQIEHANQAHIEKNGVAMSAADMRKASTVFYDPSDPKMGLRQHGVEGAESNRGVRIENDDGTFTHVLFTDAQLSQFLPQFTTGNYANFFTDTMAYFNDDIAYNSLNGVFMRLNGRSLARVANFFYPLYGNSSSSGTIQEISKDPESLSILTERKTSGPVRLSNRDVFKSLDKYNNDMFDYIANSEVVDGFGRYWSLLNSNPDVILRSENGKVEKERQDLATFIHDFTLRLKNQDKIKYKLTNQGIIAGFSYAQLMGNFAKSVFSFNLGNPVKQMTGFFSAYDMGIIQNEYLNQVALGMLGGTAASYGGMVGLDDTASSVSTIAKIKANPFFQDGYLRVMGADSSSAAGAEFSDNHTLGGGLVTPFDTGSRKFSKLVDYMATKGMEPMKRSDREVITRFYMAAEAQVTDAIKRGDLKDGNGNDVVDIDSVEAKKEIANLARRVTYATNQMFMDNDKTISQLSDSPWIRALGLFSSQPQKIANTVMQTIFEALSNGTFNLQNQKLKSSILVSTVGASVWTAMVSMVYGMLKNGYDEEKDYISELTWSSMYNIMGMSPTFNTAVLKVVLGELDTLPWDDNLGQDPVFEIVGNAAKSVGGLSAYMLNPDDKNADRVLEESIRNGFDSFPKLIGVSDAAVKYFLRDPALSLVRDDD